MHPFNAFPAVMIQFKLCFFKMSAFAVKKKLVGIFFCLSACLFACSFVLYSSCCYISILALSKGVVSAKELLLRPYNYL